MKKPFTISALSKQSGVNLETIRFYERSGLLPQPQRTASGYRNYQDADVRRVLFIRRGRELGFSLDEIRNLLDLANRPHSPCVEADKLVQSHLVTIEDRIRDLQKMQAELSRMANCTSSEAEHCRLLEALDNRQCCAPLHEMDAAQGAATQSLPASVDSIS